MEAPKENQFHYHPQQQHQSSAAEQATNVLLPNTSSEGTQMPSVAMRKRGRPRKYATPEQVFAAKKAAFAAYKERNEGSGSGLGEGFTPHTINVVAGEDVSQKILLFVQQRKHEICVLSASGSVANPSLRQSAASGGNITYEGEFQIVSLSGSYIRNEVGVRSGEISVCLSKTDGQFIGGLVAGPLNATGPVQIILGTFLTDTKKDVGTGAAQGGDAVLSSGVDSSLGLRSSGRNPISSKSVEDDQTIRSSHFMTQPQPLDMIPAHPTRYDDMTDTKNDD